MKSIVTYIDINNINDLERHPLHIQMFKGVEEKPSVLEWLHRSFEQYGKLKPIYVVCTVVDGITKNYIIDGVSSWEVLKAKGVTTITVAVLDLKEQKDIAQVMVELQADHHNSLEEEFKKYNSLYGILSKGRGHRSDLSELTDKDAEETGITEDEGKKRRATVYDVIAKMCGVSRNRVQYLLKVGKVNPWHFERIEKEKFPLYAAYLACKNESNGEEPEVPPAKAPVYESDATEAPVYDSTSSTADNFTDEPVYDTEDASESITEDSRLDETETTDSELVSINVKISKAQLDGVDTDIHPEVSIDSSNAGYVIVQLKFSKI